MNKSKSKNAKEVTEKAIRAVQGYEKSEALVALAEYLLIRTN